MNCANPACGKPLPGKGKWWWHRDGVDLVYCDDACQRYHYYVLELSETMGVATWFAMQPPNLRARVSEIMCARDQVLVALN
jgi:hypothetical protein